jgi:hypothetical protein
MHFNFNFDFDPPKVLLRNVLHPRYRNAPWTGDMLDPSWTAVSAVGLAMVFIGGGVAFAASHVGSAPQAQSPHVKVLTMHSASVSPKAQRSLAPSKATVKVNAELVALTKADATAQKATWTQVVAKNSALKGTHGVISPELAGLGTANLAVKANAVGGDRDTLEPPGIRLDASPGFDCTLEHPSIGMESGMATGGQGCHDCGGQRSDIRHV